MNAATNIETFSEAGPSPFDTWPTSPHVKMGMLGAQGRVSELVSGIHESVHRFAATVMRPIGRELDRLSADAVIAPDSRFWEFRKDYNQLGLTIETIASLDPQDVPSLFSTAFEELGWGDAGLAVSIGAGMLPHYMAAKFGNGFVSKTYSEDLLGCWAITEPDHGTDQLDASRSVFHPQGSYGRPNCVAKITDGKVKITGQKAAWVSNGAVADIAILYCAAETNGGIDPDRGAVVVVPLDVAGVTRGKPLEKMGQRALPQGELFFDGIELDIDHLLVPPEAYKKAVYAVHSEANMLMGAIFTGVARAAYELAHGYAHERKQGGVPIIRHQDVARRLFHMARKVEMSRALANRIVDYNLTSPIPALQAAMFSKVTATQNAFDVASDAVQMHGGNGLSLEYPVEKLLRDARASMIEDGCNEVLAIKGGTLLVDPDLLPPTL